MSIVYAVTTDENKKKTKYTLQVREGRIQVNRRMAKGSHQYKLVGTYADLAAAMAATGLTLNEEQKKALGFVASEATYDIEAIAKLRAEPS